MTNVGVTGALGYLGSRVVMDLKENGFDVVPVDNFSNNKVENLPGLEVKEADISSLEDIKQVFSDVDVIIHLAASSSLNACSENPEEAFRNNIRATSNIAWFCRQNEIPLSFASSVAVFGTPEEFPITEETPRNPTNLYGKTKLIGEENIRRLSEGSFQSHVFNIANICGSHTIDGERVSRENVMEIFLQNASNGEDLTVYEPGEQSRDFIAVQDVAEVFVISVENLLDSEESGAENFILGSGQSTGIRSLAEKILENTDVEDVESEIKLVENPRESEVVVQEFALNVGKLESELDFTANRNMDYIISNSMPVQ
jgi:UDP-glucose 4-epimerase